MGRLVRSRLKGVLSGDSYFLVLSCTSLVLYSICLYTFLHFNGYIGVKEFPAAAAAPGTHVNSIKQPPAPYLKNEPHFDDGKIHEFQNNVGKPSDWDLRVKEEGVQDVGEYLRSYREKRERLSQSSAPWEATKRGPPRKTELRRLLSVNEEEEWPQVERLTAEPEESNEQNSTTNATIKAKPPANFPPDYFTEEQRAQGAVVLHIAGCFYMFVALAIVCDEFFVPSLEVIIEKLGIPEDVAGATFMAAGGSAPELFTSVIGVFISFDNVGIGTIVGSAVFNVLFVIGMCAMFSRTVLALTWWPLFRDCTFYSISLLIMVLFFLDNKIELYEALILLSLYAGYVVFMRYNVVIERRVKGFLNRNTMPRISSTDHLVSATANRGPLSQASMSSGGGSSAATGIFPPIGPNASDGGRAASAGIRGSKFRHGLLTLMIHSIDPMHDGGHVDDKANKLHAIASLRVLLDATKTQAQGQDPPLANGRESGGNEVGGGHCDSTPVETIVNSDSAVVKVESAVVSAVVDGAGDGNEGADGDDDDDSKPLDMSWPEGTRKQLTYVCLLPILLPLYLTLPDARTPTGKRFVAVTFIGSILWIAIYSYLMVWWASLTGETFGISNEVMGLTFLAAGTSIPDLITSVIVARKGLGDMAVSSSVGSNIFDICVGLPLPWLLFTMINGPVPVESNGMACSILLLFGMLVAVVVGIACSHWRMSKTLGMFMFLLYFVFVIISLLLQSERIPCF